MPVRGVSLAPHPRLACPMREDILYLSGPGPPPTSKPLCPGARSSCPSLPRRYREPRAPLKPAGKKPVVRAWGASECTRLLSDSSLPSLGQAGSRARGVRPASTGRPAGPNLPPQR